MTDDEDAPRYPDVIMTVARTQTHICVDVDATQLFNREWDSHCIALQW